MKRLLAFALAFGAHAMVAQTPRMEVEAVGGLRAGDSVTGTWYAAFEIAGLGSATGTLSMVQQGSSVSGTAAILGFGAGSLSGTVSGQTLTFTINEVTPCAGLFSGSISLSADKRSGAGSINGSDCYGSYTATVEGVNLTFPHAAAIADVLGTWTATLALGGTQATATFTLVQNGSAVTGTAAISGGGSGAIVGTVNEHDLFFTIYEVSQCLGYFIGQVTVSPDNAHASGTGLGADCNGSYAATIQATKH